MLDVESLDTLVSLCYLGLTDSFTFEALGKELDRLQKSLFGAEILALVIPTGLDICTTHKIVIISETDPSPQNVI